MTSRALPLVAMSLLLLAPACRQAKADREADPVIDDTALYVPPATYEVATVDGSMTYTSGDTITPERTFSFRVRTPKGASGALPAVIVIHGGSFNDGGHKALSDWGETLAAAGYVAIHFANAEDEPFSHCAPLAIPVAECNGTLFQSEVADGGTLPASVYSRPQDAKVVLDRLDVVEKLAAVTIDRDKLAILGHSGGAHATMALAGLVVDASKSVKGVTLGADPRPKAFVANSPQGLGRLGIREGSWDGIVRPVLVQTGAGDALNGETPKERLEAFAGLPGPEAYLHYVDDASAKHSAFGLEQDPGVTGNELALARTALAFLDAQVLDRPEAKAWLASDALSNATSGVSELTRK